MNIKYGICKNCNTNLIPVWFIDEEYKCEEGIIRKTGMKRQSVSHLVCPICGHEECVDDSFDGKWY